MGFFDKLKERVNKTCLLYTSTAAVLVRDLRNAGIKADMDHCARSIKAQFKYADKIGAKTVGVIGESEMENATVVLKTMETGEERVVHQKDIKLYL